MICTLFKAVRRAALKRKIRKQQELIKRLLTQLENQGRIIRQQRG